MAKTKTKAIVTKRQIQVCEAVTYLPIKELKVHPDNPKTISRERLDELKLSIIEKGVYQPFLLWKKDNIVLSGNQRTRACLELIDDGYTFLSPGGDKNVMPVIIEDVPDEMAEAILFETNNQYGDWVEEKVQVALAQAKEAGRNLAQYGFTTQQVDDLLKDALKGAADVTSKTSTVGEHERTAGDKKTKDDDSEEGSSEKQEALILPRSVYLKLVDIFQDIAYQLDPDWRDGQTIIPAVEAFVEFTFAEGVPDIEDWKKKKA